MEDVKRNVSVKGVSKVGYKGVKSVTMVGFKGFKTTVGFAEEFRDFIESRNVIDVAIAFIMGYSFRDVCRSLVNDLFGPLLGLVARQGTGALAEKFWVLRRPENGNDTEYNTRKLAKDAGAITMNYGLFLQTVLDFLILCFVLFLFVKLFYLPFIRKKHPTFECPRCMEDVKVGANKCPHCASEPISSEYEEEAEERLCTSAI